MRTSRHLSPSKHKEYRKGEKAKKQSGRMLCHRDLKRKKISSSTQKKYNSTKEKNQQNRLGSKCSGGEKSERRRGEQYRVGRGGGKTSRGNKAECLPPLRSYYLRRSRATFPFRSQMTKQRK